MTKQISEKTIIIGGKPVRVRVFALASTRRTDPVLEAERRGEDARSAAYEYTYGVERE